MTVLCTFFYMEWIEVISEIGSLMIRSVNEIFDPDRVDGIYNQKADDRAAAIALDRGTNYGVVRLELLEHLYEKLYMQRLKNPDDTQWRCRIISNRTVVSAKQSSESGLILKLASPEEKRREGSPDFEEDLEVDYVFTATGYRRNAHEEMLSELRGLLPEDFVEQSNLPVGRNYRIQYNEQKVDESKAGVWLQGCNEGTHGVGSS
jgi:L-ornithine N5-oxygenase